LPITSLVSHELLSESMNSANESNLSLVEIELEGPQIDPPPPLAAGSASTESVSSPVLPALTKEQLRTLVLHCFGLGMDVSQTENHLKESYGQGVFAKTFVPYWYRRFRQGDFSVKDRVRAGRTVKVEQRALTD